MTNPSNKNWNTPRPNNGGNFNRGGGNQQGGNNQGSNRNDNRYGDGNQGGSTGNRGGQSDASRGVARAPYNFVPLPENVVTVDAGKLPDHDKYYSDGSSDPKSEYHLSGYFDVTLTTETPLYVRGMLTEKEAEKREDNKNKPDFFQVGGKPVIPGSSLRGMIRNLVEILGQAALDDFIGKQQLFYRAVAEQAGAFSANYKNRMKLEGQDATVKAGYMVKDGYYFKVYPVPPVLKDGRNFLRVAENTQGLPYQKMWYRSPIWYNQNTKAQWKAEKVTLQQPINANEWTKGWLIIPGKTPPLKARDGKNPVRKFWIVPEIDFTQPAITIPEEDILAYSENNGITKAIKDNKFSVLPNQDGTTKAIPCFFIQWKDKEGKDRISFGHSAYFRLPYQNRPINVVPSEVREPAKGQLDIAKAIFGLVGGSKESRAGRVSFGDAKISSDYKDNPLYPMAKIPQILSGPKPTSFQIYLEQNQNLLNTDARTLNDRLTYWDSDTDPEPNKRKQPKIRGFKLYWHRVPDANNLNNDYWVEKDTSYTIEDGVVKKNGQPETQHTIIRPVKPNVKFQFRVSFDNLSEVELGILATALSLPKEYAHKLGMGKPLGLGSVRLTSQLYVINRVERYQKLFDDGSWHEAITDCTDQLDLYKDKFSQKYYSMAATEMWQKVERLRQLKTMLTFGNLPTDFFETTKYMSLDDFRVRRILPRPSKVINPQEPDFVPQQTQTRQLPTTQSKPTNEVEDGPVDLSALTQKFPVKEQKKGKSDRK